MHLAPMMDDYFAANWELSDDAKNPEAEVAKIARAYLEAGQKYLRGLHESGASGSEVNEANSDLMDRLVRRLFSLAEADFFSAGGGASSPLCVVAVGGYSRREMNIHSDVDLLFVYRGDLTPHIANVAERMLYWLWDAAVTVGRATRTTAETISLARQDATVRTAILDPRFLAGSGVLFHEFTSALRKEFASSADRFIAEQVVRAKERHAAYGDSLYLLQPNIKDGAGGLRDYHLSTWVVLATQNCSRGIDGFLHLGLLTEQEVKKYRAALDFMWRIRNELHLLAGRKNDQMVFDLQERVAKYLGYVKTSAEDSELPVERFMRDYYRHAREIRNCSSLVIEQCRARLRGRPYGRKVREIGGDFRIADGQLEIPHVRQLRDHPVQLLTAFAVAGENNIDLTRKARSMIRENLDQIDAAFQRDPRACEAFFRILTSKQRVARSLMAMNEIGLLGRFLPEWERIVCRWQHVMYHTYTVDVHSIFLVEELRRLWLGKYERDQPEITALMRGVDDWIPLFLGCLLHDVGKGSGSDHSEFGATLAIECTERLGLSPEVSAQVVFLVRHHLRMSHIAQRRDLSDPKLLLAFAKLVGNRVNLRNLYLLTFADVRASSSGAWTDWKGQLLFELFERTSEILESGADTPNKAIELIDKRVEQRREGAAAELRTQGVGESSILAFFEIMPRRYFTAHTPRQIARHARVVLSLGKEDLLSTAVLEMRGDFSEFILCARDSHGLYSKVAGVLTAQNLNILGAHVYSTRSGLAVEVYRVGTPPGGDAERNLKWGEVDRVLRCVLSDELAVDDLLRRRGRPIGIAAAPSPKPVIVRANNIESDFYTIVDVEANDRLGLLHDLARVIANHGCEIYIAKASTSLDQVTDTFYLKDCKGSKLEAADMEGLRFDLLEVAKQGEFERAR